MLRWEVGDGTQRRPLKGSGIKTVRRRPGHRPEWEESAKAERETWIRLWLPMGSVIAFLLVIPDRELAFVFALIYIPIQGAIVIWVYLLGQKGERDLRALPDRIVDGVGTHEPIESPELSAILGVPDTRNFRKTVADLGRSGVLVRHEEGYRLSTAN